MKKNLTLILLAIVFGALPANAEHAHQKASPKQGIQYSADENLQSYMNTISETANALDIKSSDKKKTEGAGKKITETVDRIFETCKLAPDADAALHPILGEILEGANLLKKGKSSLGNEKIQHGLMKFKKLFKPAPAS